MARVLVRLRDRFPETSRATRHRWKKLPDFPIAVDMNGGEYFYLDELEAYEQAHRQLTPRRNAARDKARDAARAARTTEATTD